MIFAAAVSLGAQQATPSPAHTIRGIVFDSVSGKPLAGAVVQVAAHGAASAPSTATTDASGRYAVAGLPAGRYVVGFYHDALTALGLDAPLRTTDLAADTLVTVDLAIPSSVAVRVVRCGVGSQFTPGMLIGSVRDAEGRRAVPGARATLEWRALALDAGNYRTVTERATATIDEEGAFVACHLPVDAPLELYVTAPGHRTIAGPVVTVPAAGIGTIDLLLADSGVAHGSGMIRGRVTRVSGKTVASGRAVIEALGRDVPIRDGTFVVADLPAGTWVAEARVIGVGPQAITITAADSAVTPATITVSDHAQRLDAVTVVGKPDRNTVLLDDVLRRRRSSFGTFFLPGSPALKSAFHTVDVLREARGFVSKGYDGIVARYEGRARCRNIAVYVNGAIFPDGFQSLDTVAPPSEVLAIEAYPDVAFAPVQWRGNVGLARMDGKGPKAVMGVCAVVVVWTRQ